jgi:hypothetical protein
MVMPALTPRATPVRADDTALLHVLKAYIETLKAETEILKRSCRRRAASRQAVVAAARQGSEQVRRPSRRRQPRLTGSELLA